MAKPTLRANDADRAKRHAKAPEETPFVLSKLRGSLSRGSIRDYRRYLERKYR